VSAVSGNGKIRLSPQRAEIQACSPVEAAAAIAAVEQFVADTAPPPEPAPTASGWQRAALVEGVSAKLAFGSERRVEWRW